MTSKSKIPRLRSEWQTLRGQLYRLRYYKGKAGVHVAAETIFKLIYFRDIAKLHLAALVIGETLLPEAPFILFAR